MYKNYVYYIKSQGRLVISNNEIENKDYELFYHSTSNDIIVAKKLAEGYCIGFISGNNHYKSLNVTNDINEFL